MNISTQPHAKGDFRARLTQWVESPQVRYFVLAVIMVNAIVLGLETSETVKQMSGGLLAVIDGICLAIFVVELLVKLVAYGWRFFLKPWNIFDFLVVGVSLAPGSGGLSVLRALRILRVLRVISFAPSLRRVVEGFVSALPGMASVFLLMTIIFYIGSVMATKLFGATFPDWFGTLGRSAYSLFQIMTLESWSMGIVRPVMQVYPYAWAFFVPFIMVTTFAVVNLLVGLIVNSMQDAHLAEDAEATGAYRDDVVARLDEISARLARLEK
ncbi:ion transporter [Neptunicoccus sediminis]|uniref:ion transporter n=1 Tax=Neptunicoccus sediminis TaxID=1892596 RepID=UPI0009F31FEC|nr:ion transporter [Neptunicoccus sediminis]